MPPGTVRPMGRIMKFSICIPNYNYARYIGETVRSALDQGVDLEVLVADNASTDDSVAVVEGLDDPRVRISVNRLNVGFAGNLDRACRGATGDRMILLSSDDIIMPGALPVYRRIIETLGDEADNVILCSSQHVIDSAGQITGGIDDDPRLWADAGEDAGLSAVAGVPVLSVDSDALLRRSLLNMRNPFGFATTCYSRALYEAVEGYGGAKLIGPDKHFAWKAMTKAKRCLHVRAPLFGYRVHNANQGAQMNQTGALKHLVDEYIFSFDTPDETLLRAGVSRDDLAAAFVRHDVALRGLKWLAEGNRGFALRTYRFGKAVYPHLMRGRELLALRALLALGPVGETIAARAYGRAVARFKGKR